MTTVNPLTGFDRPDFAKRRAVKVPAPKPIRHGVECDQAWTDYTDAVRKDARAIFGLEPQYTGRVADARAAYIAAAKRCRS